MELRRKLVERMEYAAKVKTLPHDPAMDPAETVLSHAAHSTEEQERWTKEIKERFEDDSIQQHESSMDRVSQSLMLD